MIVADPRNPLAQTLLDSLLERIPAMPDDVVIVIGGDGFMLRTVKAHGYDNTYLGLSAGHLGFLLNDVDDLDRVAAHLEEGSWTAHSFPLLRADVHDADEQVFTDFAINDVYLERATGQTAKLRITIDDHLAVESLTCDGIVVSTALGSTAYNYSAGGPACHPLLGVTLVTAICPHRPRLAPFALHEDAVLRIEVIHPDRRPVRAVVDGRGREEARWVQIRSARKSVKIAYFDDHDFTSRMVGKILLS